MKTVFISDGRTQIVRHTASELQKKGFRVIINRCPEGQLPDGCEGSDLPLTDSQALKDGLVKLGDTLWCVVHPAPPYTEADIETATREQWDTAFENGALAALNVTQAAGAVLESLGGGRIIYFGDIHAEKITGGGFLYSIAEGSMQMLCREAAFDYGARGVSSHFVQRGVSEEDLGRANKRSNVYSSPAVQTPEKKLMSAARYAGILEFLMSDAGAAMNGNDLRADGGAVMFYGQQVDDEEVKRRVAAAKVNYAPIPIGEYHHKNPVMQSLKGRVALITGGGKGVGAGIARVFCAAGMKVCINYNSSAAYAEYNLKEILDAGGDAFLYQADITDPKQLKGLVDACVERYGGIDVLVNNAAMQPNRYIRHYDNETFTKLWNINIGGYWSAVQAVIPYLRKSKAGRIINISSVHGKRPTIFDAGYSMTKGAIRNFTREAALEFAPDNITVNSIALGGCNIEGKTGSFAFLSDRPEETRLNPPLPFGYNSCYPEDIGYLALHMSSPDVTNMTGSCVRIDAGLALP